MGYYQDVDDSRDDYADIERENQRNRFEQEARTMQNRFYEAARAEVGATIQCACCGRAIVKRSYQQKFCPPLIRGKGKKKYVCKDRYHNVVNPRGKFKHLGLDSERDLL